MVSEEQNFLFQASAAPARRTTRRSPSEISAGIRGTEGQENFHGVEEASAGVAQPAAACPTTQGRQASRRQPVPVRSSEPRPKSRGPSPSLPPCSATRAGHPPTAGPGGPCHAASLTFASRPGPAGLRHPGVRFTPLGLRLPQAASGGSKKPRGLRGSCGFSLPPTPARLRPIPYQPIRDLP